MNKEDLKELAKREALWFQESLNDLTKMDSPSEFPDFALRCLKIGMEIGRDSTPRATDDLLKVTFEDSDFPELEEDE